MFAFRRIRLPEVVTATALLAAVVAGCTYEPPETEFVYSEATEELLPEARDAVKTTIRESFGTPDQLVAWLKLPIEFGQFEGTVEQGDEAGTSFVFAEAADVQAPPGTGLVWLTGRNAGQTAQVQNYDPEQHRLTVAEALAHPIAAGDEFILAGANLQNGRMVYMKHCMHCHGISGDGRGPTAKYMTPKPRDYRQGIFKFTSTGPTDKASRADLARIIQEGIPGTYMPSFLLLDEQDLHDVVEYVRFLAMRGEMEKRLVDELSLDFSQEVLDDILESEREYYEGQLKDYEAAKAAGEEAEAPEPPDLDAVRDDFMEELQFVLEEDYAYMLEDAGDYLVDAWSSAEEDDAVIIPREPRVPDTAASRQRGRELYLSDKTKCYTCHGVQGRGDGQAVDDYWAMPGSSDKYNEPGLHDIWGNVLPPRDLTRGQYRGGRRPIDLYRRLYAGIKGTPMPAFGGTTLTDQEIWDLVNFVMHVPFEDEAPSTEPPPVEVASQPPADGENP